MNMKKLSAVLAISLTSGLTFAEPYRAEVFGAYSDIEGEIDVFQLGGQYHFAAVNTDSHPLAEAAFLEKSNNLGLYYTYADFGGADTDDITAEVEIYIPSAMLYVAPFYSYSSYSVDDLGSASENDWGVTAGVTPIDGLRITTTWSDEVDYELNLDAKYVVKLSGENAVNLELTYAESPDAELDDSIGAAADYYFDRTFSVGAEILSEEETGFGIRTEKFFTEQFHAAARYFTVDEVDTWTIAAGFRF